MADVDAVNSTDRRGSGEAVCRWQTLTQSTAPTEAAAETVPLHYDEGVMQ